MAIDRKDYQYIHNTLEKKSIASNDNTLKVGSKVKNLLLELNEENIWELRSPRQVKMLHLNISKTYS